MDNTMKSKKLHVRLPMQAAPVIREHEDAGLRDRGPGVGASRSARDWACTMAAGVAEKVVGSRGGEALYEYCMG